MSAVKFPTYFISHGGGPWSFMDGDYRKMYSALETSLKNMSSELPAKPKAILMISGHWDESRFSVMTSEHPPMLYDYGGFPDFTYQVQYPAAGSPELAAQVKQLLEDKGFAVGENSTRGFDHGLFTPMNVIYPKADVPILQLSMRSDYQPEAHLQVGRALAPLREQGVLIIGSGLSYHNLRKFGGPEGQLASKQFDGWLQTAMNLSGALRSEQLIQWESAPSARVAHPREDHLIPLMVAVGAAESETSKQVYHESDFAGGLTVSSFRIG